nr:MAG TPA: hypothetical protein [Caudoviricetes sp.]
MPLAGSRDSVPCGVWGSAPTAGRATNSKEAANKGAGSEASLPVTLRVLRRAPKLLYPTSMQCRAKWARPNSLTSDHSWSCPQAGVSPLRRRRGGFPLAPSTPSVRTLPYSFPIAIEKPSASMLLGFDCRFGERHHPQNAQHLLSS